jgi:hypothetical protein
MKIKLKRRPMQHFHDGQGEYHHGLNQGARTEGRKSTGKGWSARKRRSAQL